MRHEGFRSNFRRSVLTGIGALLPLILTIFLLTFAWNLVSKKIAEPINNRFKQALKTEPGKQFLRQQYGWSDSLLADPEALDAKLDKQFPSFVGLSLALLLGLLFLYLFGYFLAFIVGQRLFRFLERLLQRLPLISAVYPHAKRLSRFLFTEQKHQFNRVVAIEYPRKGVYAMAFVTSEGMPQINEAVGRKMLNCFLPTSPTPFTGFVLMVPEDEVIALPITVDQAFSFTVSGGVLVPPERMLREPTPDDSPAESEQRDDREGPAD